MTNAYSTFDHALVLHRKSSARIGELEKAIEALSTQASPAADADYDMGPQFSISVRHAFKDVDVHISASPDFLRPLFEAALITERASFDRMERKLAAARVALQSD